MMQKLAEVFRNKIALAQLSALTILLVGSLFAAPELRAEEQPLQLLFVREAQDLEAQSVCIRGQLFLVKSYDTADMARRVRIADTLELFSSESALNTSLTTSGEFTAVAETSESGWSLRFEESSLEFGAFQRNQRRQPSVVLGRRARHAVGTCELSESRLEDSEIITQRLRQLVAGAKEGSLKVRVLSE